MIYDLTKEKWINVFTNENKLESVSIKDLLINAHKYKEIIGDNKLQEISLFRFALAFIYTIYQDIADEDDWVNLWEDGKFSKKKIDAYFKKWNDRFYMIHDKYPFYQVPEIKKGTELSLKKLIGNIDETNNKMNIYNNMEIPEKISLDEAARWLIYQQAYGDESYKNANKTNGERGWLGRMCLIKQSRNNLFESLMLNFIPDQESATPSWERECVHTDPLEIAIVEDTAALLTIQTRRICLDIDDGYVVGGKRLSGEILKKTEDSRQYDILVDKDPMCVWKLYKDKVIPNFSTQSAIWKGFPDIVTMKPRNINWIASLEQRIDSVVLESYSADYQCAQGVSFTLNLIKYNSQKLHTGLFDDEVSQNVSCLCKRCISLASRIGSFANDLANANGCFNEEIREVERQNFYMLIDSSFKIFLSELTADNYEEKEAEWLLQLKKYAFKAKESIIKKYCKNPYSKRTIGSKTYFVPQIITEFSNYLLFNG